MIRWTGLAPWEFEYPFPGSLASTFLGLPATHPSVKLQSCVPPALTVGANRRFQDPWFALQVAGFRRAPVQLKGIENGGLI